MGAEFAQKEGDMKKQRSKVKLQEVQFVRTWDVREIPAGENLRKRVRSHPVKALRPCYGVWILF